MTEHNSSYKQILKATSLFGGVQIINILISIVRSKLIAILLGPIGIGIAGMLTATIGVISGLTNFGLGTSAVRDISSAYETGNSKRIAVVSNVLQRWVWITGLLGSMITLLFSPFLSYLSFGNWDYTVAFMFLSITMLMNQLNSGQLVIIQGSRKLGFLAKANLIGSIIGLFTTIPLYYVWGINGIVPALVISSIVAFIISNYFRKKIQIENVKVSNARVYLEGKQMLKMGLVISMSGFISLGFSYIVRLFIAHIGGITELGLYNSGFTIITTYVGLIFTAMGTDYYPRLAGVSDNLIKRNLTINNQSEITMIIIGPIVIIFIVFIKFIVNFLYSKQFIGINDMIVWAAFGMLFKSMSWSIAFLFLAKGDSKFFFRNELFTNLYLTFFNLIGYKYGGLTGLGISFSFSYLIYFLQVYIVTYKKFSFKLNNNLIIIFLIQTIACSIALIIYFNIAGIIQIILNSCIIFISLTSSIIELNKRIKILDYLRNLSS